MVQGLGLNINQKYDCNMAFDLSEGKYNIYVGNTREYSKYTFFYVRCLDGMGGVVQGFQVFLHFWRILS